MYTWFVQETDFSLPLLRRRRHPHDRLAVGGGRELKSRGLTGVDSEAREAREGDRERVTLSSSLNAFSIMHIVS